MKTNELVVTCAPGVASVLAEELRSLEFPVLDTTPTGVRTRGGEVDQIRLCRELRTAHRVLVELWTGRVPRLSGLYRAASEMAWEEVLGPDGYVRILGSVRRDDIRDERVAFFKLKDAVMDRLREVYGRRPDSGPEDHGASLFLHWVDNQATISLDLAGVPLSRRGYRPAGGAAPLQEALAAAMLLRSGWDRRSPVCVPMGGAGTIAIEAALMASDIAPGTTRADFGYRHFRHFTPEMETEAAAREQRSTATSGAPMRIVCTDQDPAAVERARENAARAGVAERIEFSVADFRRTPMPEGAWVFLNPPYGLRLQPGEDLEPLYREVGGWLKGLNTGGMAWVLTGNLKLAKRFGLKLADRHTFYNGSSECRYLGFHLETPI